MSATPPVVMYSTAVCPYCMRAEQLLHARGVTEIEKIRIDLDPARRDEMITRTSRRTVPQIFIGATHVGGFDDQAKNRLKLFRRPLCLALDRKSTR